MRRVGIATALFLLLAGPAATVPLPIARPTDLPDLPPPDVATAPAKELFGRKALPADLGSRAIGFYAKGCLAGARPLPINGPAWQVMRLSRNRNWGHPALISLLERLARQVPKVTSWQGLLVGDMSQPRGGPMLTGHASHQVGLDADVWLNPMPGRTLTPREREDISAKSVVASDWMDVDPRIWTPDHLKVIRLAAIQPEVERVLVNPAIKKALCREARGDRSWLAKVRPYWGHNYHMHIRLGCPAGSTTCRTQAPIPGGEQCDATLDAWFKKAAPAPKPAKPVKPKPPPPPMRLSDLPSDCRTVLEAADASFAPTIGAVAAPASKPETEDASPEPDASAQ